MVKWVKGKDCIVLWQINQLVIFIIKLNVNTNCNWVFSISWATNCHCNRWIVINLNDSFSIWWWKALHFVFINNFCNTFFFATFYNFSLSKSCVCHIKFVSDFYKTPLDFIIGIRICSCQIRILKILCFIHLSSFTITVHTSLTFFCQVSC